MIGLEIYWWQGFKLPGGRALDFPIVRLRLPGDMAKLFYGNA
jgi:hypothetical protein